ncbi:hypothetical protein [Microbacterium sp. G2-8]|uniref:hypothetical protein n=1 Tax=Microbacterium sp. G2-8 TaxID=2842454 RepID=UPI001C89E671|nr:hypothetical protein [Microbacterium sp. G2-8]
MAHSDDWIDGFAEGRTVGERFRAVNGTVVGPGAGSARDALVRTLTSATLDAAARRRPRRKDRAELRRRALRLRERDFDGVALGLMALLADRWRDPAAKAWLAPMLAGSGRFREAARRRVRHVADGPSPSDLVVTVSALSLLGRTSHARKRFARLREQSAGVRSDVVSVWDDTALGREYRALVDAAPRRALPVFYHLPFCGGTSVITSIKQVTPWSTIVPINRRHGLFQIEAALQLDEKEARTKVLVHQHHPYALEIPGRELSFFTVLRDPVSQLSSGFHKRLSTRGVLEMRDGSETFADHAEYTMRSGLTNMLARQIAVTHPELRSAYRAHFAGRGNFRSVGTEEDLFFLDATADLSDQRLLDLCREALDTRFHSVGTIAHLGASHLAGAALLRLPVARRVVHTGKSGQPTAQLPDALDAELRAANAVDQTLYDEYTERFRARHAGLIAATEAGA